MPDRFCREFAEFGCNQLALIMATVLDLKPLMDVWVPATQYDEFKRICSSYNLEVQQNSIVRDLTDSEIAQTYGQDTVHRHSTTKNASVPFSEDALRLGGEVHCFISTDANRFDKAIRYCWYNWVAGGILVTQPLTHLARFGTALGYPDCCIDFYTKSNRQDIPIYFNRLKNTKGEYSYYCNNILNHLSHSYIHHTTCSLDCSASIRLAKRIEEGIGQEEPAFVERIKKALRLPLLVYGEKNCYVFDGLSEGNEITYSDVCFVGDPPDDKYGGVLARGNRILIEDDKIEVRSGSNRISAIRKERPDFGFLLQFV